MKDQIITSTNMSDDSSDSSMSLKIYSVEELLKMNLEIPNYQRPYKWTLKNVQQLIQDIERFLHKSAYRLGTVVLHEEHSDDKKYIVDGQQRTITLMLLVTALIKAVKKENESLDLDKITISELSVNDEVSKENLLNNYREIEYLVKHISDKSGYLKFLLENCKVVVFVLKDISEAFQFFDSQNARGKDLDPHDLLKAYHLREFPEKMDKTEHVNQWQKIGAESLATLFEDYLFRIRRWTRQKEAIFFTKKCVSMFKGINLGDDTAPFFMSYEYSHLFLTSDANANKEQKFPFQLDGHIVNGARFFEFVKHYSDKLDYVQKLHNDAKDKKDKNDAKRIMANINEYNGRNRTGDKHIRMLFDCALLYYVDRFGEKEIDLFIPRAFAWAYELRIRNRAVSLRSVNKHVLETKFLQKIGEAVTSHEVMQIPLTVAKKNENRVHHLREIIEVFIKLNCYNV